MRNALHSATILKQFQLHDRKVGLLITGSLILGMMAAGGPAYAASSGSDELDLPPLTATSSEDVPDEYLVYPERNATSG